MASELSPKAERITARVARALAWLIMMGISAGWGIHFGHDLGFRHGVNATVREFVKAMDAASARGKNDARR